MFTAAVRFYIDTAAFRFHLGTAASSFDIRTAVFRFRIDAAVVRYFFATREFYFLHTAFWFQGLGEVAP